MKLVELISEELDTIGSIGVRGASVEQFISDLKIGYIPGRFGSVFPDIPGVYFHPFFANLWRFMTPKQFQGCVDPKALSVFKDKGPAFLESLYGSEFEVRRRAQMVKGQRTEICNSPEEQIADNLRAYARQNAFIDYCQEKGIKYKARTLQDIYKLLQGNWDPDTMARSPILLQARKTLSAEEIIDIMRTGLKRMGVQYTISKDVIPNFAVKVTNPEEGIVYCPDSSIELPFSYVSSIKIPGEQERAMVLKELHERRI